MKIKRKDFAKNKLFTIVEGLLIKVQKVQNRITLPKKSIIKNVELLLTNGSYARCNLAKEVLVTEIFSVVQETSP